MDVNKERFSRCHAYLYLRKLNVRSKTLMEKVMQLIKPIKSCLWMIFFLDISLQVMIFSLIENNQHYMAPKIPTKNAKRILTDLMSSNICRLRKEKKNKCSTSVSSYKQTENS